MESSGQRAGDESSRGQSTASRHPTFRKGDRITVHGLTKSLHLNGRSGVVRSWNEERGCYAVLLDGESKPCKAKPENLRREDAQDPDASSRDEAAFLRHDEDAQDPDAIFKLAGDYYNGEGVGQDKKRAAKLWEKAANQGHLDSIYNLGWCYSSGNGVDQDKKRAADLLQKAANQGHLESIYNLGNCYRTGNGVDQDKKRAVELYQQAANQGHLGSIYNLGVCYRTGEGVGQDKKRAVELYQKAANQGHVDSIFALGCCYEHGNGVGQDKKRAAELYQKAANQGHLNSIYNLGVCYLYGKGIEQDYKKAFEHMTMAANEGNARALLSLANMYQWGCSVPVSIPEAQRCIQRAIEHSGDEEDVWADSIFNLSHILSSSLDPKDLRKARKWVAKIPRDNRFFNQSQWLLPFIEDQLDLIQWKSWNWPVEPKPDFFSDSDLQLVALIGEGQFGQVYLGRFRHERWVAVKFVKASMVLEDKDVVRNILRERFTCRVIDAQALPCIVRYLGFIDDVSHNLRGLVFELCADISDVKKEALDAIHRGFVPPSEVDLATLPDWTGKVVSSLRHAVVFAPSKPNVAQIVRMLRDVAMSLHEVHKLGFIHCDIAARNILCDKKMNVWLADFGLAKYVDSYTDHTLEMKRYYTIHSSNHQYAIAWWAPECFGSDVDYAIFSTNSDVYSFAVLMWQCLAGRDPFDDIFTRTSHGADPSRDTAELIRRIRDEGETPDIGQVRRDAQDELVDLIEDCWNGNPEERPTLPEIIERLENIQLLPAKQARPPGVRNTRQAKEKWNDVKHLYRVARLDPAAGHGSFGNQNHMQLLKSFRHVKVPSLALKTWVRRQFNSVNSVLPRDVFLIHTGVQKKVEVAMMEEVFKTGGLESFLDQNMVNKDGPPTEQMARALESCRHAIVLVSKAFLEKRHPCAELVYAFERNEWLSKKKEGWVSLWVVLYDLTVDEYQAAVESPLSRWPLPKLGPRVVISEWKEGAGIYRSWPHLCYELRRQLIEHDNERAVKNWTALLEGWEFRKDGDFPSADGLYGAASSYINI